MSKVIFYEKPGCMGNHKQKIRLRQNGYHLTVKDLLTTPWTPALLREFFHHCDISQCFNQSAPMIKSGELDIASLSEQEALQLMCREPILIRRPLLSYNNVKQAGFTAGPVLKALGIQSSPEEDGCPMQEQADDSSDCKVKL